MKFIFIFAVLLILSLGNISQAILCHKVQNPWTPAPGVVINKFSEVVHRMVRSVVSDPTALRKELKNVVDKEASDQKFAELANFFGSDFALRVEAKEGTENINSSAYMTIAQYTAPSGEKKSVKVRFRRYFSQDISDPLRRSMKPIPAHEQFANMEIKIEHPFEENISVKVIAKVRLEDIPYFTKDHFLGYQENLQNRMLQINSKSKLQVNLIIEFMSELYSNPFVMKEYLFGYTEYARTSFSITLKHKSNDPKKSIRVEITADNKVRLIRLIDSKEFDAYGDDKYIIELKVPKDLAAMTSEDIANYPGLAEIVKLKMWMETEHDSSLPPNRGKIGKISTRESFLLTDRKERKEAIFELLWRLWLLD